MQKLGFEQFKFLDEVDQKGEAAIDAEIEEVNAKIFQDHKIDDEGRVNELRTVASGSACKGISPRDLSEDTAVEVRPGTAELSRPRTSISEGSSNFSPESGSVRADDVSF